MRFFLIDLNEKESKKQQFVWMNLLLNIKAIPFLFPSYPALSLSISNVNFFLVGRFELNLKSPCEEHTNKQTKMSN